MVDELIPDFDLGTSIKKEDSGFLYTCPICGESRMMKNLETLKRSFFMHLRNKHGYKISKVEVEKMTDENVEEKEVENIEEEEKEEVVMERKVIPKAIRRKKERMEEPQKLLTPQEEMVQEMRNMLEGILKTAPGVSPDKARWILYMFDNNPIYHENPYELYGCLTRYTKIPPEDIGNIVDAIFSIRMDYAKRSLVAPPKLRGIETAQQQQHFRPDFSHLIQRPQQQLPQQPQYPFVIYPQMPQQYYYDSEGKPIPVSQPPIIILPQQPQSQGSETGGGLTLEKVSQLIHESIEKQQKEERMRDLEKTVVRLSEEISSLPQKVMMELAGKGGEGASKKDLEELIDKTLLKYKVDELEKRLALEKEFHQRELGLKEELAKKDTLKSEKGIIISDIAKAVEKVGLKYLEKPRLVEKALAMAIAGKKGVEEEVKPTRVGESELAGEISAEYVEEE